MGFSETIELVGKAVDVAGVAAIVIGAVLATYAFLANWRHARELTGPYERYGSSSAGRFSWAWRL